jgi:hypothetical protein
MEMARTGVLNGCPVCRAALWAEDCWPLGDKQCPRCGTELWVLDFSEGPAFFPRRPGESLYDFLAALAGGQLGFSASEIEAGLKDADEFDLAEILYDVEEVLRSGPLGEYIEPTVAEGTIKEETSGN